MSTHLLIRGLLAALPDPSEDLPPEDRERWLKAMEMNLAVIYGRASRNASPNDGSAP